MERCRQRYSGADGSEEGIRKAEVSHCALPITEVDGLVRLSWKSEITFLVTTNATRISSLSLYSAYHCHPIGALARTSACSINLTRRPPNVPQRHANQARHAWYAVHA